jgi:hypothetical protein
MSQGYAPRYIDTQLHEIQKVAASPAQNLENQIDDEIVP